MYKVERKMTVVSLEVAKDSQLLVGDVRVTAQGYRAGVTFNVRGENCPNIGTSLLVTIEEE